MRAKSLSRVRLMSLRFGFSPCFLGVSVSPHTAQAGSGALLEALAVVREAFLP